MIVTISNEYGTGAVAIARDLAIRLGYVLVNEQLPVVVAKRLQTTPENVEAAEDTSRSVGERILTGLEVATPEVAMPATGESFDECLLREVQAAVREYAAQGNVVIVGRASFAILGRRSDVLRVFLYAPRDWRIHHVVSGLDVGDRTAAAEVDRIDKARRGYLADWYDLKWGEMIHYDLSLDVSSFGHDGTVALIEHALSKRA